MLIRTIGTWKEEKISSGQDSGYYVEAVALARSEARYAKLSYTMIEDADLRRLERGESIPFPLVASDLATRIDAL